MIQSLFYSKFPEFNLNIIFTNNFIQRVDFLTKGTILNSIIEHNAKLANEIEKQLDNYLKNPKFKFSLPLKIEGSDYQKKVWQEISNIPSGFTLSYGEVAWLIRSGPRAVGNACGKNNLPILIPCHRVIGAKHKLGGFMQSNKDFGVLIKSSLLEHESK